MPRKNQTKEKINSDLFQKNKNNNFSVIFYDDCNLQPKLTVDFLNVSSNHFYSFFVISVIGHLSFLKSKKINFLVLYLIFLAIFLETLHLIVPNIFGRFCLIKK